MARTVSTAALIHEAESIERSAKESQDAWTLLGQYDKFGQQMDKSAVLRRAAAEKSIAARRYLLSEAAL